MAHGVLPGQFIVVLTLKQSEEAHNFLCVLAVDSDVLIGECDNLLC